MSGGVDISMAPEGHGKMESLKPHSEMILLVTEIAMAGGRKKGQQANL